MIKNKIEIHLNSLGFELIQCGGKCPFQVEGYNQELDIEFYFRSRGNSCSLELLDHKDGNEECLYKNSLCQTNWDKYDAGYINEDKALSLIKILENNQDKTVRKMLFISVINLQLVINVKLFCKLKN